jgi:voltage-gated potassium channel
MEIIVLILSVVVLLVVAVDVFWRPSGEISRVLQGVDSAICVIFLGDFFHRLWRAPNRREFLRWGWIDLLASIPSVDALRWGRLFRLLIILRMLRALRGAHRLYALFIARRFQSGIAAVLLTTFLVIAVSSVCILLFETEENTNIRSAEDALWWSATTITTVGYGDKYPITPEGRLVAVILMFIGVGLFGMLSGLVASLFLGAASAAAPPPPSDTADLAAEVRALREQVARLHPPPNRPTEPE